MLIPITWLKQFVPITHTPERVAETLTLGGFEVETIKKLGVGLESLLVGEIKTIVDHAEADRLCVCTVDIGKRQRQTIVCGAKNIKPGDKVPVALPGTTLPNGMTIERRKIRGIESAGMLCAEDEMGLGDDHSGILILDRKAKVGQKVTVALGLNDVVLDVTVSPQRADAQSLVGLAREYAALTNQSFKEQKLIVSEDAQYPVGRYVKVRVADPALCPKYTCRVIRGVKIGPSPAWLQARLRAAGHTPINSIVDITNYVLLEYGQPLHAFDAKRVQGGTLVVKKVGRKQAFTTLDGVERQLAADMLMICDAKVPIAIAGVMGGAATAITEKTTDIILESAIFKPTSIRKTRQSLNLATDASQRFERGIWWELPELAIDRAAQLIREVAGGTLCAGRIVIAPKNLHQPRQFIVSVNQLNELIGVKLSMATVIRSLQRLSFGTEKLDADRVRLTVPAWRMDVRIPADVAEEVGRLYGWNKLKVRGITAALAPAELSWTYRWRRRLRQTLAACGMSEVYNYSLYGENLFTLFGWKATDHFRIMNPMNKEQEYLRVSLVPGLYVNVLNSYQQYERLALFELGRVFYRTTKSVPDEHHMAAGIIYERAKKADQRPIRELQGVIRAMARALGVADDHVSFAVNSEDAQVVDIVVGDAVVGWYGWLIQHEEKLGRPPVWFEIDIEKLAHHATSVIRYQPVSNYPAVVRDMTFVMPVSDSFFEVRAVMQRMSPLIVSVEALDLFPAGADTRHATFRLTYQALDRTLHTADVNEIEKKIITMMANRFKAPLRR